MLHVWPDTIKFLEKNVGMTLSDINYSKIFFDPHPRVKKIKTNFDWWKDIKKDTKLLELFVYFGDYSLVDCFICKYFSHSESCSFVYGFLCCARAFKFN